jgi:hypothetical protein
MSATAAVLDDEARAILEFEREAWRLTEPKARAIRARFGCSPVRYRLRLSRIVGSPEGLAHDPVLVTRLRRVHLHQRASP